MASFYVIRGRDHGQHFAIRGASATIGRESVNQIQLHDSEVSRRHARIIRNGAAEFEILDAQSSNGTFVNGQRIDNQVLRSGDRIQVGSTLMIFTGGPELHSTRSLNSVEIVTGDSRRQELSQIRSSMDSQLAFSDDAYLANTGPSDSKLSISADAVPASQNPPPDGHSRNLEIVYQVSQAIHRTGDLNELLRQVLDLIFRWIDCDRGCILMNDEITGQLRPVTSLYRDQQRAKRSQRTMAISQTILDYVCRKKEGVLTGNAQDDERWNHAESVSELGVHEAMCVPMLGRYGLVGAVYVDTSIAPGMYLARDSKPSFENEHLLLMMAIAGQAALAIEDTQFYQAMLQSERLAAMGQTIANLSHHVKNILQGVSGGNYLVDQGISKEDIPTIRKGWDMVQRNQERISNLVLDMLSYSKQREPELVTGDLTNLIEEIVELVSPHAKTADVALRFMTTQRPLRAMFDAEAIHRALLNVVSNAVDATAGLEAAEVAIQARLEAEEVEIRVTDTGPGISEDDVAKIFVPFESSKGARGTGLGLPVSQKILREHGGDLSLESKPGEPTCFLLHWPANGPGSSNPPTLSV